VSPTSAHNYEVFKPLWVQVGFSRESTKADDGTNFWYRVLRWVAIICPLDRFFNETALLEIELSLLEFAVSITRSVRAIEVSVVRDRITRSVSLSIQKLVQRESVRLPERQ
jgi:hypothetical protein